MTTADKRLTVPDLKVFLETIPPGARTIIDKLGQPTGYSRVHGSGEQKFAVPKMSIKLPTLRLHCDNDICQGERQFMATDGPVEMFKRHDEFLVYVCQNCKKQTKTYAVAFSADGDGKNRGEAYKYGEVPPFGPPVPSRLISLVGPDREYFLKGRRAENQGLGIGAFGYYRRVVENQKNRILDEIIRVSEKLPGIEELIADLERAKKETRFSKAVDEIKHALPAVLMIDGHNPLTLLHGALSEGLHAESDSECLAYATSIRVVITELTERVATAISDRRELQEALGTLLAKKPSKT